VLLTTRAWPGADLALEATERRWHGLKTGRGRLRYCQLDVRSSGRGRAVRPKTATITLGDTRPLVRVPAPPSATDEPATPENPLWATVEPSQSPDNPWQELTQRTGAAT
jgi:hypothetical protein